MQFFIKGVCCAALLVLFTPLSARSAIGPVDITKIRLTISLQGVTLKEAFEKIERVSSVSVSFLYDEAQVNVKKTVTASFTNTPLKDILDAILVKHDCQYKVNDNVIIVLPAPKVEKVGTPSPVKTGSIRGNVYDAQSNEALVGASVVIEGTHVGTAADIDGSFVLSNIQPGRYNLVVSFIGYQPRKLENIEVTEGKEAMLAVALATSASSLSEIVIQGSVDVKYAPIKNSTEVSLIHTIRETPGIITGISNQQIVRSLDRDAGQIVKRVPGVSLVDKFVMIRGLSPRYNVVHINGLLAPSSEADRRAFSFDLLPTGVIDQIMVYKSPAPELPSGFAGGVVKIKTKSTNIARRFRVGFSAQYQPGSSFTDHQTYGQGSNRDWLALGANDREWRNKDLYDLKIKFPEFQDYPQENVSLAKDLQFSRLKNTHQNLDKRLELEYYDSWRLGSMRLNNLTSAYYTNARDFNAVDYQYLPRYTKGENGGEPVFKGADLAFVDSVFTHNVRMSAMQNFSLHINENHQLAIDNLFNMSGSDKVVNRDGFDADQNGQQEKNFQFEYKQKRYYQGQLSGAHTVGKVKADWRAGYTSISENAPDVERFYFTKSEGAESWDLGITGSKGDAMNRIFAESTKEKGYSAAVDLQYLFTEKFKVIFGGLHQRVDRKFYLLGYNFLSMNTTENGLGSVSHPAPWVVMDTLFSADKFRVDGTGYRVAQFFPSHFASYQFDDRITAGYVGLQYKFWKDKLSLHTGVRYENNMRDFFNYDGSKKQQVPGNPPLGTDNTYWLPSINLGYEFIRNHTLRLSYGKTIDRPDYREQTDFIFYDYNARANVRGNPYLKVASIHNYDLRWEFYPREGEFIAVGTFYKRFRDAIEMYDNTTPGWVAPELSFENTKQANVYGVELEVRRSLDFISKGLKNFSVIANAAFTKSSVVFYDSTWDNRAFNVGLRNPDRPLIGTSPYVVNLGVYYNNENSGTQFSLLYNVIGQRLIRAAGASPSNTDQYELPRQVIDLVLTQRITKFFSIKAGVQDLLNQKVRLFRDEDLSGDYNPGAPKLVHSRNQSGDFLFNDYVETSYRPGSYYSLGLQFTF